MGAVVTKHLAARNGDSGIELHFLVGGDHDFAAVVLEFVLGWRLVWLIPR